MRLERSASVLLKIKPKDSQSLLWNHSVELTSPIMHLCQRSVRERLEPLNQFPSVMKGLVAKRKFEFLGCVVENWNVSFVRCRKVSISSTKGAVSRLRGDPILKKNGR